MKQITLRELSGTSEERSHNEKNLQVQEEEMSQVSQFARALLVSSRRDIDKMHKTSFLPLLLLCKHTHGQNTHSTCFISTVTQIKYNSLSLILFLSHSTLKMASCHHMKVDSFESPINPKANTFILSNPLCHLSWLENALTQTHI